MRLRLIVRMHGQRAIPGTDLLDALFVTESTVVLPPSLLPDNFHSTSDAAVIILALMKKELCVRGPKDTIVSLPIWGRGGDDGDALLPVLSVLGVRHCYVEKSRV